MQVKFLAYLQQICFCLVSGSHMTSTVPNILHGLLPQNSVDTYRSSSFLNAYLHVRITDVYVNHQI